MFRALVLAVAALSLTPVPARAQTDGVATLDDLAWIAGQWVGGQGDARSEEVWTAPSGDAMIGMWRLVRAGESRVFELLAIVRTPQGPVFRLRHFSREFVAWEEKDRPVTLPLVRHGAGEAVFEGTGTDGRPLRLTYRRPAPATLTVLLEHGSERQQFEFQRAADLAR